MSAKSTWLKKYGMIPKIIFVILFFVLLGGVKLFILATAEKNLAIMISLLNGYGRLLIRDRNLKIGKKENRQFNLKLIRF